MVVEDRAGGYHSRVTIRNHPVKHDFMQVGRLELEHLVDASSADLVRSGLYGGVRGTKSAKRGTNEVLAKLVKKIKSSFVSARGYFNKFSESIPNLSLREGR